MRCPRCHMEQEDLNLLCDYCGVMAEPERRAA
jgi:hypothetical protein